MKFAAARAGYDDSDCFDAKGRRPLPSDAPEHGAQIAALGIKATNSVQFPPLSSHPLIIILASFVW
jgi:hypothetical protein